MRPLPPIIPRVRARPPQRNVNIDPPRRDLSVAEGRRRPPPPRSSFRGSQSSTGGDRPPPSSEATSWLHRNKSTGISYLDTWMGNQTSSSGDGRRPSHPTSTGPTQTRDADFTIPISSHSTSIGNSHVANVTDTAYYLSSNLAQFRRLPSATYQILSIQPTRFDTPETLLDRLRQQVKGAPDDVDNADNNNGDTATASSVQPLVLDLTAFHPDGSPHSYLVGRGTLTKFVDAIRSYQRAEGNSTVCVVGVSNLPDSMAEEALSMALPIFRIGRRNNFDDGKSKTSREKRGGVAPLLRQRRPGVAATSKVVVDDSSTLTTKDDASLDGSSDVQIVGMGALAPHDQVDNGAKVHRGSIRSGQLITSDRPNQSLVIIGSVNPGGEVWSEGDVYVFGKLRGRVLAGLSDVGGGDSNHTEGGGPREMISDGASVRSVDGCTSRVSDVTNDDKRGTASPGATKQKPKSTSKIIATSFDPELVCIGHKFITVDDVAQSCGLLEGVGPAMVTVDEVTGELLFEKIEL